MKKLIFLIFSLSILPQAYGANEYFCGIAGGLFFPLNAVSTTLESENLAVYNSSRDLETVFTLVGNILENASKEIEDLSSKFADKNFADALKGAVSELRPAIERGNISSDSRALLRDLEGLRKANQATLKNLVRLQNIYCD